MLNYDKNAEVLNSRGEFLKLIHTSQLVLKAATAA